MICSVAHPRPLIIPPVSITTSIHTLIQSSFLLGYFLSLTYLYIFRALSLLVLLLVALNHSSMHIVALSGHPLHAFTTAPSSFISGSLFTKTWTDRRVLGRRSLRPTQLRVRAVHLGGDLQIRRRSHRRGVLPRAQTLDRSCIRALEQGPLLLPHCPEPRETRPEGYA